MIDASKYFASMDQSVNFVKFEIEQLVGVLPCEIIQPVPTMKKINSYKLVGGDMTLFGDHKLAVLNRDNIKIFLLKWSTERITETNGGDTTTESDSSEVPRREEILHPILEIQNEQSLNTYNISNAVKIDTMIVENETEVIIALASNKTVQYTVIGGKKGDTTTNIVDLIEEILDFDKFAIIQKYLFIPMGPKVLKFFYFDESVEEFEEIEMEMEEIFQSKDSIPTSITKIKSEKDPTDSNKGHLWMGNFNTQEIFYITVNIVSNKVLSFTLMDTLKLNYKFINFFPILTPYRDNHIMILEDIIIDIYYRKMKDYKWDKESKKYTYDLSLGSAYEVYQGMRNMLFGGDGLAINIEDNLLDVYSQDLPYTDIYTHSFGLKELRTIAILQNIVFTSGTKIKVNSIISLSGGEVAIYQIQNSIFFLSCPAGTIKEEISYQFMLTGISGSCEIKQRNGDYNKTNSCYSTRKFKLQVYPYSLENSGDDEVDYQIIIICCSVGAGIVIILVIVLIIWCKKYRKVKNRMKKYLECHDVVGKQLGVGPPADLEGNNTRVEKNGGNEGNVVSQNKNLDLSNLSNLTNLNRSTIGGDRDKSMEMLTTTKPLVPSSKTVENEENKDELDVATLGRKLPPLVKKSMVIAKSNRSPLKNSKLGANSARGPGPGPSNPNPILDPDELQGSRRMSKNGSTSSLFDRSASALSHRFMPSVDDMPE